MPGGVSTGTSIIAVEFDGGVVLGADSRTSTGASSPTAPPPTARRATLPATHRSRARDHSALSHRDVRGEPRERQADGGARSDLLLPVGKCGGHAGGFGLRPLLP